MPDAWELQPEATEPDLLGITMLWMEDGTLALLPSRCTVLKWLMMEKWLFMSVPSTISMTSCEWGQGEREERVMMETTERSVC